MNKLNFIGTFNKLDFYEYKPSVFRPYYLDYPLDAHPFYEKHVAHKIRMFLEYVQGGYSVYYFALNNEIVGHIVVASGGRRLSVSKKEDIVIGPVWVSFNKRGQGIGTSAISVILKDIGLNYHYAYEFIMHNNVASIKTVEKNGYKFVCRAKETGFMKRVVKSNKGDYLVYRYSSLIEE